MPNTDQYLFTSRQAGQKLGKHSQLEFKKLKITKKILRKTPRQRRAIACLWETKLWWNWSRLKKIATVIFYGLRDGTGGGARSKHYSGSRDKHRNWDVEKNDHDLQLDNIIFMGWWWEEEGENDLCCCSNWWSDWDNMLNCREVIIALGEWQITAIHEEQLITDKIFMTQLTLVHQFCI